MEFGGDAIKTENIDHHGLVAAICKDLNIAERIDNILYKEDTGRVVTPGESVVAMIINGLGFTNRRLYLTSQFFENKPVEKLIAPGLKPEDITYDTLVSALDNIWEYGESKLYGHIALDIGLENNFLGQLNHLDTTSLSVEGNYPNSSNDGVINITHGHSKDHRPDLKQLMLSLVVTGDSGFPLWMETLDGNSSDKTNFHHTISNIRAFQSQLNVNDETKWVADSALYTKDKLLMGSNYLWLTRVPETIKEAKALVSQQGGEIDWIDRGDGYKTTCYTSHYGDIQQRWLLVYTEQGYQREMKTFENRLIKLEKKHVLALKKTSQECFSCEGDAKASAEKLNKSMKFFSLNYEIIPETRHKGKGRPKAGEEKHVIGYRIKGELKRNAFEIENESYKKGRFILASNDLDEANYPDEQLLKDYKSQQKVERGFRFLKDPYFMLDSIFLKKPERISALMMVMTLCLMVYNVAEYRLRKSLQSAEETLPNQKGKAVSNPTLRWVFQLMEGVSIVYLFERGKNDPPRQIITNINPVRSKIIHLFGESAYKMYGLAPEG